MALDLTGAVFDKPDLAGARFDPPPAPRGTLGEIGTGFARGALVGLPTLAGQVLQYASSPGNGAYDFGKGLVTSAEERGQKPSLTLQPQSHGMVTNALASGAEMVAPGLAVPLAIGAGAAAAGASPFIAGGAAIAGAGALFGAQAGQTTLDKAEKAGVDPQAAQTAARINAATTFATQTAVGAVGGQLLGVFGKAMGSMFTKEAGPLAEQTMQALTGNTGVLMPTLKALPTAAAEGVALNTGQAAVTAAIDNSYGIDSTSPLDAAKEQIGPALGMTALLTPMGLVARSAQVRSAQARTSALAHPETAPEIRTQLANQYAEELAKADPQAAANFRLNANIAIEHKQAMDVDAKLLMPGAVLAPAPEHFQPDATPALGRDPRAGQMVVFPDGTTGYRSEIESYIAGLPEGEQLAARAKLAGLGEQRGEPPAAPPPAIPQDALDLHAQVKQVLTEAGEKPAEPLTKKEFADGKELKGQELAKAYKTYLDSPEAQRDVMRRDADAYEALQVRQRDQLAAEEAAAGTPRNPPPQDTGLPADTGIGRVPLADAMNAALKRRDEAAAFAGRDATKDAQLDAIANITKGEQLAQAAERGELLPDANAPKRTEDLVADWHAAMEANGMDTKPQARVPFEKRIASLGLDKMATHQDQIDALKTVVADKKVSQGVRDRTSMLVDKLEAEMPAKQAEPIKVETTEAAAAKTDVKAAEETTPTTSPRQAVLDGLVQPGATRVEALAGLRARAAEEARALMAKPEDTAGIEALQAKLDHYNAVEAQAKALDAADANKTLDAAPSAETAALGENIPKGKPSTRGQPPKAAAVTDTLTPNIPESVAGPFSVLHPNVSALAEAASDRVMDLRVAFNDRIRGGEKLSPLEQERYEDLNAFAKTLARYTEGKGTPSDEGFVRSIAGFVEEASQPYKQSMRNNRLEGPRMQDPQQVDLGLLAPAALSHRVSDVLAHMEAEGSEPWVKTLAARLKVLLPDTTIFAAGRDGEPVTVFNERGEPFTGSRLATFDERTKNIDIYNAGASETTILHEATHAATVPRLKQAAALWDSGRLPRNQEEAQLKAAFGDLVKVVDEARKLPEAKKQYGVTNELEFVAELYANADFRNFLKQQTLWERTVNAVRRLLGMSEKEGALLARAIDASEPFFSSDRINYNLDGTPYMASRAIDGVLNRVILTADDTKVSLSKLGDAAFKAVLPWKTVEFIAHQVRGIPEMVASGFSNGVDAHQRANTAHQVAATYLNTAGSKFVDKMDHMLRAAGDTAKAQAVQREMAIIGGEASRVGFDYRKNFNDNALLDKTLDIKDKAYVDEIHRRFTQLQRTNPEAAKLLEDGERLNRTGLIDKVATIAANVMDARAGVARRLAADLERLPPGDAQRAVLEQQVRAITLESTLAAQHSAGLDFLDPTLRTAKNPDPVRFHDGASAALGGRLEAAFKAADALPEGTPLRAQMQALAGVYRAQLKNPYFSLGRDGDYFVKVGFKGIDAATNARIQEALKGTNKVVGDLTRGDDHAFFRVDTPDEAKALHDKLVLAGQGRVQGTSWGRLAEHTNEVTGVAPALRTLLSSLDETVANTPGLKSDQAALMKDTITRQVLSMLPETSSRSASMGRRGIPGYDSAFLTSFARRAGAAVHDTAGLYTNRAYAEAAKMRADAIQELNRTGTAQGRVRAQEVDNEINTRFANSMKPTGNSFVGLSTSLSHSFYLGLSPAFFIRTMAQPWHRGLPIIGSKFGYTQSMGALVQATPVALKVIANTMSAAVRKDGVRGLIGAPIELTGLNLTPGEQGFINELHLRGVLDLGESSQLQRAARGGGQKMQDAVRMASVTAQMAEMSNRLAMGLASFRLAESRKGLTGKETSTEYAIRTINLAMDNFDPSNTARAIGRHGFAGPLTPLFTQFQNYALQTMQQISRTVHDGMFNQDKSAEGMLRSKEAKREFAGLMATTGMAAGALGLPFANAFAGVYNMFMSDPDDPKDVRISIRNWAADTFGKDVAGVLMHGPAHAIGVDTASFGLQGVLPGSDFLASRMQWKDRAETQARSMLGPAVSLGMDLGTAISKMSDGYWLKGIEAALPVGLRTYYKAGELATVGYTDTKGNPMAIEAGKADVAWRLLGFQTAAKAEQGDAARDFITNEKLLQHRRGIITDHFVKGVQDPSILADAGQQLQAFNAKNPTQAISGREIAAAIRTSVVDRALGVASGTGVSVSKRQLPALVENERFAAMPGR